MKEVITSLSNLTIKNLVKLKDEHNRKKSGLVLIEGAEEIGLAVKSGLVIDEYYFCPEIANENNFLPKMDENNIKYVSPDIFKKISFRENPDGIMAVAQARYKTFYKIKLNSKPLIVVMEAVEKPGNLGAIMRTAEAAGADLLIVANPKTDIYNHNVIRNSRGAVFSLPIVAAKNEEAIVWLQKNKIKIYAATPDTDIFYAGIDFKDACAIVIGTEHEGLSQEWLKAAYRKIKIPMFGRINSLNASVSGAVIIYEAVRQRSKK